MGGKAKGYTNTKSVVIKTSSQVKLGTANKNPWREGLFLLGSGLCCSQQMYFQVLLRQSSPLWDYSSEPVCDLLGLVFGVRGVSH